MSNPMSPHPQKPPLQRTRMPISEWLLVFAVLQRAVFASASDPPVTDLVFAPGGKTLVAVSQAGIQEYSWQDRKLLRSIESEAANLHCVAFSPDGKLLAIGGGNPSEVGIVEVFSWPEGKPVAAFSEHDDSVMSLAWLGESRLVSASLDRMIYSFDLNNADSRRGFPGHSRGVSGLCILREQSSIVSIGHDQSVRVWNAVTSELVRSLSQHTAPIHCVALRPTKNGLPLIATAASDRTIRFWQPTIGRMVRFVRLEAEPLKIAWTNDAERVVAVCADGRLRIVDPVQVKVVREVPVFDGWAYAVAVHPSDGSVAVGGPNCQIKRVDLKQGDKNLEAPTK